MIVICGSGKHLKRAIEKYGIENFKKEILFNYDNEAEMKFKEAELVNEDFVLREDTYNICVGGKGGWSYVNISGNKYNDNWRDSLKGKKFLESSSKMGTLNGSNNFKKAHKSGKIRYDTFKGKKHTTATKAKISLKMSALQGNKNSQFGTMWITNGTENKKIKSLDTIPEGWYKGRKMKDSKYAKT